MDWVVTSYAVLSLVPPTLAKTSEMTPGAEALPELVDVPHLSKVSDSVTPAPRRKPAMRESEASITSIQALPLVEIRVAMPRPSKT